MCPRSSCDTYFHLQICDNPLFIVLLVEKTMSASMSIKVNKSTAINLSIFWSHAALCSFAKIGPAISVIYSYINLSSRLAMQIIKHLTVSYVHVVVCSDDCLARRDKQHPPHASSSLSSHHIHLPLSVSIGVCTRSHTLSH